MKISIGIISDTHNLLRPEAIKVLVGSDIILHAGDIGSIDIIEQLKKIAPVHAIRGNIDKSPWSHSFPNTDVVKISGKYLYVLHNINDLDLDPVAAGFDIVISGHSHEPSIKKNNGVLYINPGSAGPRRFKLPVTIAELTIDNDDIKAEIIEICLS